MSETQAPSRIRWLAAAGAVVVCLPALWHLGALAWIFVSRAAYPMDIEWMEGGSLYQAYRILHGQTVFGPPQEQGFVPYIYPPGHSVILAAIGGVFGLDYGTGRVVSILAVIALMGAGALSIWRAEGTRIERAVCAVLATGAIAAAMPVHGGWYDLIRNDSLAIAFPSLAAVLALRPPPWPKRSRAVLIGLLLVAAVYTKQTGIFFTGWILLFTFIRDRRAGLWAAGVAAAVAGTLWVWLHATTGGWFTEWMFMARKHKVYWDRAVTGLSTLVAFAPYTMALPSVLGPLAVIRRASAATVMWTGMLVCALPASLLPYAKGGGFLNDFMPFVAMAPIAMGLLVLDVVRATREQPRAATAIGWFAAAACAVYLIVHVYDPRELVPSADLRARTARLEALVRSLPGRGVIPNHPFLAIRTGQRCEQFQSMAFWDADAAEEPGVDLSRYLGRIDADWAVLDGTEGPYVTRAVFEHFEADRPIVDGPNTLIGSAATPGQLLRRLQPKHNVRVVFDFEAGLDGWTKEGEAFDGNPTAGKVGTQEKITGFNGCCLINSFHADTLDRTRGRLLSPPFVIDRAFLGLRVGGGSAPGARVELHVGAQIVQQAGGHSTEYLEPLRWPVGAYQGQQAQLWIIDDSDAGWGHILVDDVELFDP